MFNKKTLLSFKKRKKNQLLFTIILIWLVFCLIISIIFMKTLKKCYFFIFMFVFIFFLNKLFAIDYFDFMKFFINM